MSCSFCHHGRAEHRLPRHRRICSDCLRAAAISLGWQDPQLEDLEDPRLPANVKLVEHDLLFRPVVAAAGPFSTLAALTIPYRLPQLGVRRWQLVPSAAEVWSAVHLDCAAGLLQFKVPGACDEFETLLQRWEEWANYRDLLRPGSLRTYLDAIEQLLSDRWQECLDLLEPQAHEPTSANLRGLCLALLGDWQRAIALWERLDQPEAEHNLQQIRLARGRHLPGVAEMVRLATAVEEFRAAHGFYPPRLESLTPRHLVTVPPGYHYRPHRHRFSLRSAHSAYPRWQPGLGVLFREQDLPAGRLDPTRRPHTLLEAVAGRPPRRWLAAVRESQRDLEGAARAFGLDSLERYLLKIRLGRSARLERVRRIEDRQGIRSRFFQAAPALRRQPELRLPLILKLWQLGVSQLVRYLCPAGDQASFATHALRTRILQEKPERLLVLQEKPLSKIVPELLHDGCLLEAAIGIETHPEPDWLAMMGGYYGLSGYTTNAWWEAWRRVLSEPVELPWLESLDFEPDQRDLLRAALHLRRGSPQTALDCLRDHGDPRAGLLRLAARRDPGQRGLELAILHSYSRWGEADFWAAELALERGQPKEAETSLRKALEARPKNVRYRARLAWLLGSQDRHEEAEAHLEVLQFLRPDLSDPVAQLISLPRIPLLPPGYNAR